MGEGDVAFDKASGEVAGATACIEDSSVPQVGQFDHDIKTNLLGRRTAPERRVKTGAESLDRLAIRLQVLLAGSMGHESHQSIAAAHKNRIRAAHVAAVDTMQGRMRRFTQWFVLTPAIAIATASAAAQAVNETNLGDDHIQNAIRALTEKLYSLKHPQRFWELERVPPDEDTHQAGGYTALAIL